jgi:hypothetical protein
MANPTTTTNSPPRDVASPTPMYLAAAIRSSTPNAVIISPPHFLYLSSFVGDQSNHNEEKSSATVALAFAVECMTLAKDLAGIEVAKAPLSAACGLLTMIRVSLN